MEVDEPSMGWKKVTGKVRSPTRKHVTYSQPDTRIKPPCMSKTSNRKSALTSLSVAAAPNKPPGILRSTGNSMFRNKDPAASSIPLAKIPPPLIPPPAKTTPPVIPITQSPNKEMPTDASVNTSNTAQMSQATNGSTLHQVKTNDGTTRITIRWTPTDNLSLENAPKEWLESALLMLNDLFRDDLGVFYRWESQDLLTYSKVTELTLATVREFISPRVAHIYSTKTFIFGLRFAFSTKTPVKWMMQEATKNAMRKHKIWATTSNSSCSAGDLVTAGYLLMKAPNTTHCSNYLKWLRSVLPETTPFFDIGVVRKTMADQSIPHLMIQCGKNHVTTLNKLLSEFYLTSNASIYLPREIAGSLPTEKVAKYFEAHKEHMRTLRMICLAPMVTNLDREREEFLPDGNTCRRTPREWAMALTVSTGANAKCDIVNGGSDRLAYLLVPKQHYDEIAAEASQYKMRISPLEQRETRYRDRIPGLPAVIRVDISVQAALDRLDLLSSAEVWNRAPATVRGEAAAPPPPETTGADSRPPVNSPNPTAVSVTSNLSNSSSEKSSNIDSRLKKGRRKKDIRKPSAAATGAKTSRNPQEDASTHSVASSIASKHQQQYLDLEKAFHEHQAQREDDLKRSSARFDAFESRFDNMEKKQLQSMQYHMDTSKSLSLVQTQMDRMMTMLQDLHQSRADIPSETSQLPPQLGPGGRNTVATLSPSQAVQLSSEGSNASNRTRGGVPSTDSLSSGSITITSPLRKKRSIPATHTMDADADSTSAATAESFGNPPRFPIAPATSADPNLSPPPSIHRVTDMDVEESNNTNALPDLDDQYKQSPQDGDYDDTPNPDRGVKK